MEFKRADTADSIFSVESTAEPTNTRNSRLFGSRTSVGALPSLPDFHEGSSLKHLELPHEDEESYADVTSDNAYVEFDLSSNKRRNNTKDSLDMANFSERVISTSKLISQEQLESHAELQPKEKEVILEAPKDDDFFSSNAATWKDMRTITDMDYYDERGQLEFAKGGPIFDSFENRGYTKIDTEEQVAKYSELDAKTDFLFKLNRDASKKIIDKLEEEEEDVDNFTNDDMDEVDDNLDSTDTLATTKGMLSDSQKFAYVGIIKLISVDMATELATLRTCSTNKIAKTLSFGQRNFSNWTQYVITKLYDHLDLTEDEKKMIENLSIHGLEVTDLSSSLLEIEGNTKNKAWLMADLYPGFDLRWVLVCDLLLILLSDGYYDARSNTLLVKFALALGITNLEILQFQRRLLESLELETTEKSIENKDELLNDRLFIEKHIKKNRKRRYAYIGLATLGGSLAIGLSAGLLAPVIGAGLAAGLTTVGITGSTLFLAGVGGSAIITTGGVLAGAKVGSKAGARRTGEVHNFEFKPLHNNKRPNLIITVSGWMNGKLDDVRLPFSTTDPVMGDMFSLLWEPEMLTLMGQTINILASEALTTSIQQILGATILTALMSAIQLPMALSKLSYLLDNPWNVSLDRAWKAGLILADTLIAGNMGVRPITLVGFSLGARLIYSCLIELAKRGGYGLIENVILLGSPITIKRDQMVLARSVVSGRFINGYSKKDWILGYLFRATGGGLLSIAGLSPIENVNDIENIDCTQLVEGHMSYRTAIPKILKLCDWEILSEEFAEIEEADPETVERQRQLIIEFDEAREKMQKEKEKEQKDDKNKKKTWKDWFRPKLKEWWEIYEGDKNSSKENNDPHEEYMVSAPENADPIFDVNALMHEIKDIENIAEKDPSELEKVRQDVNSEPLREVKPTNEDLEERGEKTLVSSVTQKFKIQKPSDQRE